MADIWDFIDCEGCPHYRFRKRRTRGDPDRCCPDEAECSEGDFGDERPCGRTLSRIEEGLRDGDFGFSLSYLIDSRSLTDSETKEGCWDVLEARPDVDWGKRPYWRVFYDETAPIGFDTAEEAYEEVFQ
ncbi:MAG: hypothetical protein LBL45_09155 [Treponema sp.]|jgi:hypothetical protein|nr:hypothetical protein [Treponema sp.]